MKVETKEMDQDNGIKSYQDGSRVNGTLRISLVLLDNS